MDGSFKQDWPQLTDKAGETETWRLSLKAAGTSGATCTTSPDHMKKKQKEATTVINTPLFSWSGENAHPQKSA